MQFLKPTTHCYCHSIFVWLVQSVRSQHKQRILYYNYHSYNINITNFIQHPALHTLAPMIEKPCGSSAGSKSLSLQINNSQAVHWADSCCLVHNLRSNSRLVTIVTSACFHQWLTVLRLTVTANDRSFSQLTLGFRVFKESCQSAVSKHFLSSLTANRQILIAVHCWHELPGHPLYGQCMTCQVDTRTTWHTWHMTHEKDTKESPLQAGKLTQEWLLNGTWSPESKTSQILKVNKLDLCVDIVRDTVATQVKCDKACGELCTIWFPSIFCDWQCKLLQGVWILQKNLRKRDWIDLLVAKFSQDCERSQLAWCTELHSNNHSYLSKPEYTTDI